MAEEIEVVLVDDKSSTYAVSSLPVSPTQLRVLECEDSREGRERCAEELGDRGIIEVVGGYLDERLSELEEENRRTRGYNTLGKLTEVMLREVSGKLLEELVHRRRLEPTDIDEELLRQVVYCSIVLVRGKVYCILAGRRAKKYPRSAWLEEFRETAPDVLRESLNKKLEELGANHICVEHIEIVFDKNYRLRDVSVKASPLF